MVSDLETVVSLVVIFSGALTMTWWIVRLTIRSELDQFKTDFARYLDGLYVRRGECTIRHEIDVRRTRNMDQDA